jgi:hypothetical protein
MKNIILFALSFICLANLYAQEAPTFKILERKLKSNKTVFHQVVLEDLISADSFDGKYFKIVNGKSNEAICFDEPNPAILLKAATTYYHLTLARKFWQEKTSEASPQKLDKIIVRLEIKNLYDEQGHFAHDNRTPQFNNALSIPAGETPDWLPSDRQEKWEREIWFRPMKKIETKDLPGIGPNPLTVSLQALEQPFINYTQNQFNQSLIEHLFYPTYAANPLWVDIVRFAGTIALTKAIMEGSKHTDRLFVEKYYYLDTAMVPEVIYHEYAHIVLSDYLEMSHSTPVIEGMADYFAAVLSKKKQLYARVKGYSNAAGKNTNAKNNYSHWYESNRAATADFVLSVLWDVRETLGSEVADKLVYEARTSLKTKTATINHHLIQAVLDACDKKCEKPRRDKLKLYETFSLKGF